MDRCEVVEVRSLEDAQGYACSQLATAQCGDCGREVCGSHSGQCELCGVTFCGPCLSFHRSEHSKRVVNEYPAKTKKSA